MKNRHYLLLAVAILIPLVMIAANSGTVSAQYASTLQCGSTTATTQFSGAYTGTSPQYSVQLTLPVSTVCPAAAGQLWAVGNVYDTNTGSNVGSATIALTTASAGYYSGQLVFTLPASVIQHSLQVQVSVYNNLVNGQYTSLLAMSTQTVNVNSNSYSYTPPVTYNAYSNSYPEYCSYLNGYMYCYYSTSYGNYYHYYSSPYYYTSACYNGEAVIYHNWSYYAVSCYYS